jgi:hypothetical protein
VALFATLAAAIKGIGASVIPRAGIGKAASNIAAQATGRKVAQGNIKESAEALVNRILAPSMAEAGAPPVQQTAKVGKEVGKPFGEKARDFTQTRANWAAKDKDIKTPVAEQIKGLSLAERAARLEKKGALLTPFATAEALNIKSPDPITMQQRVHASEAQEEQARLKAAEAADEVTNSLIKLAGKVGTAAAAVTGLVIGIVKLPKLIAGWGEAILESQKPLQAFNVSIATAFARLEYQRYRLAYRTGVATSGTTGMLAGSIEEFREEFQPLKEAAIRFFNVAGAAAVKSATYAVQGRQAAGALVSSIPGIGGKLGILIKIIEGADIILRKIEENTKDEENERKTNAFRNVLKEIRDRPAQRQNDRPGADGRRIPRP